MKERLTTLVLALGALTIFGLMFLRGEGAVERASATARPTSQERRENGHFAAWSWLQSEGIRARSWRERFERLEDPAVVPAARGNLLVVTLPVAVRFDTEEFLPLGRWVGSGNTLLILAALADDPEWADEPDAVATADLNLLTGLEFQPSAGRGSATSSEAITLRATLTPNRAHAYFQGVQGAVAQTSKPARPWRVQVPYDGFVLALAHDSRTRENVFWTRPMGEGRVIVSGFGSLFSNRLIGEGDNARLFANLVAANVAPQGTVLFDDLHQGLGAAYDPQQFYADPRLYVTIAILAALWFIWVTGSTRLRAPVVVDPAPSETALVRAAAGSMARLVRPQDAARALIEHALARMRGRAALVGAGDSPWAWLERHPRVAAEDVAHLRRWHEQAHSGGRVPLGKLQNLLLRIERQLA